MKSPSFSETIKMLELRERHAVSNELRRELRLTISHFRKMQEERARARLYDSTRN